VVERLDSGILGLVGKRMVVRELHGGIEICIDDAHVMLMPDMGDNYSSEAICSAFATFAAGLVLGRPGERAN